LKIKKVINHIIAANLLFKKFSQAQFAWIPVNTGKIVSRTKMALALAREHLFFDKERLAK